MNYPDTAPADLSAFSHWPDALTVSEEIAARAQPTGYAEPEVTVKGIPLDIVDAVLAWRQSGTSHIQALTSRTTLVSIFAFGMG